MKQFSKGELKGAEAEWLCGQHHFLQFQKDFSRNFFVVVDEKQDSPQDNLLAFYPSNSGPQ
jgi:hypothetical protein